MTISAPEATTTKLENTGQLGYKKHTDGGWGLVPIQTRSERFASIDVEDFPAVTGREAVWKLTPLDRVADLIDGPLDGGDYDVTATDADGVDVGWVDRDRRTDRQRRARRRSARRPTPGRSSSAPSPSPCPARSRRPCASPVPALGPAPRAAHVIIEAKPFSTGLVILANTGPARLTENVEIIVGDGANLTVVTVQQWDDDAVHLASHFTTVGRDARIKHVVVTLGGSLVRVNPSTHLNAQGGEVEALGLYFADAGQHLEQQVYVDHDAPHTRSRVTYKGALQGAGARTVWVGDVLIRPDRHRHRQLRAEPQPRAHRRHPGRLRARTWRSRPATSSAPATPARPVGSTTSSCSTCRPAASGRMRHAASSSAGSSPRSCSRSATPNCRSGSRSPSRKN